MKFVKYIKGPEFQNTFFLHTYILFLRGLFYKIAFLNSPDIVLSFEPHISMSYTFKDLWWWKTKNADLIPLNFIRYGTISTLLFVRSTDARYYLFGTDEGSYLHTFVHRCGFRCHSATHFVLKWKTRCDTTTWISLHLPELYIYIC